MKEENLLGDFFHFYLTFEMWVAHINIQIFIYFFVCTMDEYLHINYKIGNYKYRIWKSEVGL